MRKGITMIKIGAGEVNATPVLGKEIPGYFNVRNASGVLSDLYAKAIVIDDGKTVAAIAALDSLGGSFEMVKRARKLASEKTGIPEEKLLLEANKWEIRHGGISGRTAQQFINYLANRNKTYIAYI